jgi:glycerol uptake facilitator-like aquaporin
VTWAFNLGYKFGFPRAGAYLAGFLLAYNVSGAHFNPATSIAVYLQEKAKGA